MSAVGRVDVVRLTSVRIVFTHEGRFRTMGRDGMPLHLAPRVLERIEGAEALGPAPRCVCAKCSAEERK